MPWQPPTKHDLATVSEYMYIFMLCISNLVTRERSIGYDGSLVTEMVLFRHLLLLIFGTHPGVYKLVWWQNGDLGLGWVLEYIQRFIADSGRWDPTDHKSD